MNDTSSPGPVLGIIGGSGLYDLPGLVDTRFLGATAPAAASREAVEEGFVAYMEGLATQGTPWSHASRHLLGLYNDQPGARRWRQVWSDHRLKSERPTRVMQLARAAMTQGAKAAVPLA